VVNGNAVVFLGNKGYGKSTMAATLYARGHSFLADDLVLIVRDQLDLLLQIGNKFVAHRCKKRDAAEMGLERALAIFFLPLPPTLPRE